MAPFTYQSDVNPYASSIGAMLAQRGQIAADAAAREGALRGDEIRSVGGMLAAIPQHLQAQQDASQKRALTAQELAINDLKMKASTIAQQKAAQAEHDADASELGYAIHTAGNTPEAVQAALGDFVQRGKLQPAEAQQFAQMAASDPSKIPVLSRQLIGRTPEGRAALLKTVSVRPGGSVVSEMTGNTVASAPAAPERPVVVAPGGTAISPSTGAPIYTAPAKAEKPTAEQEDARYEQLTADRSLGKPIAPEDAAWSKAYEQRKKLTVDASASAAADRQAKATENATAQQKRSQDFQQLQTARADIQKNADTIYSTAHTAAETLRDTVAAAKAGNKFAASQQTLEGTMATLKSQGFSRLNATELGVSANAGNLWDRISGYLGKKAEGQPVPADLQKDMLAFADILDKAAYKKYSDAHDAVNKLYGTSIPKTFQAPAAPAPSAEPIKVGGFSVVVK